VFCR